jgi:hypothetical protein
MLSTPPDSTTFLRRRRDRRHDLLDLVHSRRPRKNRFSRCDLGENAPQTPHVDPLGVPPVGDQNLRSSVPPRGHVICQRGVSFAQIALRALTQRARQSKIGDLAPGDTLETTVLQQ